jgi:hypothetical protein
VQKGFGCTRNSNPVIVTTSYRWSPRRKQTVALEVPEVVKAKWEQRPGRMTRARNKSLRSEALWQVYQLNTKTGADDQSKQRRSVSHAFAVIIVMLLALGGLLIWAAWL